MGFGALGMDVELGRRIHGDSFIVADSAGARWSTEFFSTQRSQRAQRKKGEEGNVVSREGNDGLLMGHRFLVGGRELAKLSDGGGDHAQGEINVRGSGVAAKAKAEAGTSFFRGQADRGEDV